MNKLMTVALLALVSPTLGCAGADLVNEDSLVDGEGYGLDEDGADEGERDEEERCAGTLAVCATDVGEGGRTGDVGSGGGNEGGAGGGNEGGAGGGNEGGAGGGNEGGAGGGNEGGAGGGGPEVACYVVDGNPSCESEGLGQTLIRIDPVTAGLHTSDHIEVTLATDGVAFDFTSDTGVSSVIVKGGPNALVCTYSADVTFDNDLVAPFNLNSGTTYGLSHIDLCTAD